MVRIGLCLFLVGDKHASPGQALGADGNEGARGRGKKAVPSARRHIHTYMGGGGSCCVSSDVRYSPGSAGRWVATSAAMLWLRAA